MKVAKIKEILKGEEFVLKRKIYEKLLYWKKNKKKECLLVKGARQIGKTYIIEQFGKENYKSYIYINFIENPNLKNIFEGELTSGEIYKRMSVFVKDIKFIDGDTLVFLDEIQDCPNARTALKFLALDERYDVIASGSLLGINYREVTSIPVGYERQIEMHSLDFEEFLWAIGVNDDAISYIKTFFESKELIPAPVNAQMLKYLREYIAVGGMPDVVNTFVKTNNFNEVQFAQEKILESYLEDISKYASLAEKPKTRNCFLSIPRQLAKENKKFQFSLVESGGRARKYENCLEWLRDANLIRYCYNVSTPTFPLTAYEKNDQYKIYINDIGLLTAMYGFEIKHAIIENKMTGPAKGGIFENLAADMLIKNGHKLNYYKTENNSQEIEFLINDGVNIIPIEIKAGNHETQSLNKYIEEFSPAYAFKFISGNIGVSGKKITMPLYMLMFV